MMRDKPHCCPSRRTKKRYQLSRRGLDASESKISDSKVQLLARDLGLTVDRRSALAPGFQKLARVYREDARDHPSIAARQRLSTIVWLFLAWTFPAAAQNVTIDLKSGHIGPNTARLELRLLDGDRDVTLDQPAMVNVSTPDGEILFGGAWKPSHAFILAAHRAPPPLQLRVADRPEDARVLAVVALPSRVLTGRATIRFPVSPGYILLAAFAGALLWSIYDTVKRGRSLHDRTTFWINAVLTSLGALVSAVIVIGLASVELLGKLIGADLRLLSWQSYTFLGLFVAYGGIDHVLALVYPERRVESNPEKKQLDEMVRRLSDVVVSTDYVAANPGSLDKLQALLAQARHGSTVSERVEFIHPRLADVYAPWYREDVKVNINAYIEATRLRWSQRIEYWHVRTTSDVAPDVTYAFDEDIDGHVRSLEEAFHHVVLAATLSMSTEGTGVLTYDLRWESGEPVLVARDTASFTDARYEKRVKANAGLSYDEESKTTKLRLQVQCPFPLSLKRAQRVRVVSETATARPLRDDVYYLRLQHVTHKMDVTCLFPGTAVRVEVVKFEWRPVQESPPNPLGFGRATLSTWLVQGNGVAIAWSGVLEAAAAFEAKVAKPEPTH